MNSGPQKSLNPRPLAPSRPVVAVVRPIATMLPVSKMGLWISLGIHACIIAAACSLTFNTTEEQDTPNVETPGDRAEFKVAISNRPPQLSEPELPTRPTPLPALPQPQIPLIALNQLTAQHELPTFEPIAEVTAGPPATPAAPSTAGESKKQNPKPSGAQKGKTGGKKRNGNGNSHGGGKQASRAARTSPPQLLSSPPPRYPTAARSAKKAGKVGVLVRVRANGSAASTSLYHTSGSSLLDQAAVAAARSWRFSKSPSLGREATIVVVVQVTFVM